MARVRLCIFERVLDFAGVVSEWGLPVPTPKSKQSVPNLYVLTLAQPTRPLLISTPPLPLFPPLYPVASRPLFISSLMSRARSQAQSVLYSESPPRCAALRRSHGTEEESREQIKVRKR